MATQGGLQHSKAHRREGHAMVDSKQHLEVAAGGQLDALAKAQAPALQVRVPAHAMP